MFQDVFAGVLGLGSLAGGVSGLGYLATTLTVATGGGLLVPLGLMLGVGIFFAGKQSKGE